MNCEDRWYGNEMQKVQDEQMLDDQKEKIEKPTETEKMQCETKLTIYFTYFTNDLGGLGGDEATRM